MQRGRLGVMLGLALLGVTWIGGPAPAQPKTGPEVQWIWFNEGDPAREAPAETRYFRKVFTLDRSVDEAALEISADNQFTVWLNGVEIGRGTEWQRVSAFDVKKHVLRDKNVLAVQAHNTDGPAGLMARLGYALTGQSRTALVSDASWKASKTAADGWRKAEFDDSKWLAVKVIGPVGKAGPWQGLVWDTGGMRDRFEVPSGFVVQMVVPPNPSSPRLDPKLHFTLVNMAFDNEGRLLISQENGPVLLCTEPDKNGIFQNIRPYCDKVKNCQGICWARDALLLVGEGPQGAGLYRVRSSKKDDKADEVKLLHKFQGGMGEHGPHAIVHGPDDWLYLVIGNHGWAKPDKLAANSPLRRWPDGQMGPDQGKPNTTEDVLLPRLNDANGHAANILAPGGTIWRLDHDGKNMSLVAAGFRNHFDAAFSPNGELFTFDSDMEWDEGLPWYRAVRICHCPPGADFVWRTGAANTPDYYIDSLPPLYETGRGSPVGLEFYDHFAFPKKYRGAYFMADWSLGIIWAVHLERAGATYKARSVEKFCVGKPMNVTDLAVGPDGALYFSLGGRGTQGGVYRIGYSSIKKKTLEPELAQPLAAWSRAAFERTLASAREKTFSEISQAVLDDKLSAYDRIKFANLLQMHHLGLNETWLLTLAKDKEAELRAQAVWLLGVNHSILTREGRDLLLNAQQDSSALVRRRACEALIRAGIEPSYEVIWPLLADKDRFVRTAARLVLERIDPKKWTPRMWSETKEPPGPVLEGIIALCQTNQTSPYAEKIFAVLRGLGPSATDSMLLDYLRTVQMALIHTTARPDAIKDIAERCFEIFPHADWRANRELAILLSYFRHEGLLNQPVHTKLLDALLASSKDRMQQIHYFYCLRLLHQGWTLEQRNALLAWYDATKSWTGGASFTLFLENILRDANPIFTPEDRARVIVGYQQQPWAAVAMLRLSQAQSLPAPSVLADLFDRFMKEPALPRGGELKEALLTALGQNPQPEAQAALRQLADKYPAQRDAVARILARFPSPANWPYLLRGLESTNPVVVFEVIEGLRKVPTRPKVDEPGPFRAVLLASNQLNAHNRWKAVELLRHWSDNRQFGADAGNWISELTAWSKWFGQAFPKEPPLPNVGADKPAESKYQLDELLAFLEKDPKGRKGDVTRGRIVFEKAQCLKCHKFGKEGEGLGPDLTTLSKRFKRVDILESIIYPSKVISDQYRSTTIETKNGQQFHGLAAPQGNLVTVLLQDGSKVTLKKEEIASQFSSLVSVMPEKLLDPLTKEEIVDLFAFLESEPAK